MARRRITWSLCLLLLGACGFTQSQARTGEVAFEMGRFDRALARAEATVDGQPSPQDAFKAHLVALQALGRLAWAAGEITERDPQARDHYERALALAGEQPELRAELELALAEYYGSTYRLRSALPHLRTAQTLAAGQGRPDLAIRALHRMAQTFAQMGELELRTEFRDRAMKTAKDAFPAGKLKRGPTLDAYVAFLDWDIADARNDPNPRPRVVASWIELDAGLEEIFSLGSKFSLSPYVRELGLARRTRLTLNAAIVFARTGDEETARALFNRVASDLVDFGGDVSIAPLQNRLTCARAQLEFDLGRTAEASALAGECIAGAQTDRDRAAVENRLLPLLGRIKEDLGELDAADALYRREIVRFETIRQSIPVAERATFFRGAGRVPWDGLVRVRARQYAQSPSDATLVALLEASDGMRARQLLELDGRVNQVAPNLKKVRERLGPDAVLISFAFAGHEIIVTALSQDDASVARISQSPQAVAQEIAGVADDLARAGSGVADLHARMEGLGATLLDPVSTTIAGKSRIVVIGDATLNAFPFELLRIGGKSLEEDAVVSFTPSVHFYERSTPRETQHALYALGDPVYAEPPTTLGYLNEAELATSRGSSFLKYFAPLPETRTEVQSIAALFGGRATVALGEQATESFVKRTPPEGFAYVHFATHGILAGQVPGLAEPALVLGTEDGEDGFLTAGEVADLKLSADLAVLSACSTGAGRLLPGEGVMGMGRAFLGAGSRGVLVSLWPVDSAATEALMVRFYTYHLAGLDPARALHLAKRDVAAVPAWSHPFYWSAFILVSEGGLLRDRGDPGAIGPGRLVTPGDAGGERGFEFVVEPAPGTYREDFSIQDPFGK